MTHGIIEDITADGMTRGTMEDIIPGGMTLGITAAGATLGTTITTTSTIHIHRSMEASTSTATGSTSTATEQDPKECSQAALRSEEASATLPEFPGLQVPYHPAGRQLQPFHQAGQELPGLPSAATLQSAHP